jgi:hypothetical protein
MRRFARFTLLVFFAGLFAVQLTRPAYAAGMVVNTNADNTTAGDTFCTLREAITNANANTDTTGGDCTAGSGSSTDTITFAADYTITLSSSLPDITDLFGLTITGNGAAHTIVQAAASAGTATYRVLKINAGTATLEAMTIRYGVEASGGAINNANGNLTLNNVTVSDSQVKDTTSNGINGGAISTNGGTVTINNSTISNNSVTTSDTSTSRGNGGGIFIGATGTVNLNNSTVSGNSAKRGGGGLYTNGGTINVSYSTIANNTSDSDNDAVGDGGGINRNSGTLALKSSIVAGNKKSTSSPTDNDCSGTITTQGYNLTGSSTGCSISGTGDTAVTPSTVFTSVLGSLSDNGGQTYTHALIVGGAAVDAIPNGTNSCGSGSFTTDQRGGTRPYNSNCDMGAYELKTVRSVATTGADSGDCSLTDCLTLTYAYGKSQAGDTINVAAGTYTTSSQVDISHALTIAGAGASSTIVQAAASAGIADHRVFRDNGATVTLSGMTIRYGVEASGGGINNASGTLTLNNVTVSDNQVKDTSSNGLNGGGISINGGTTTINNSTFSNNSVTTSDTLTSRGNGGAIFFGSSGSLTLNNVTLSGNSAKRAGGGLYMNGSTVNVNYSTIANNTSDSDTDTVGDGGGIARNGGTLNLKSSIVAGNKKASSTDNDCTGTITSQGYNLTGSSTGCSLSGTGDVTVAPSSVFTSVLGSLTNNGGQTSTHLLYGGNAAQDVISSGTNGCGASPFDYDQRGYTRPYNSSCDIGAFESQDARPSVSISSTAGDPTSTSPIPVTVTFSESVTGFTAGDITFGNATISNFSGSGASYSFDLTPSGDGSVTADIAAGVAQDSVFNYNTAATQFSRTYDTTGPSVTSFTATSPTNSLNIPITAFTASDSSGVAGYLITTSSTPPSAGAAGWSGSASTTYTVAGDGAYTLYPWAKDAAGNVSAAYGSPASVTVDTTAPSVTSFTATSPTNSLNIPITAFTASDSNGVTGYLITTSSTPPSAGAAGWAGTAPSTYTVASAGAYTLYPWAKDALGNVSAAYGSPASVTVDTTAPTVTSITRMNSNPTNTGSVDFVVGFSESGLTGIDTSDFTLTTTGSISGASVTNVSPFATVLWTVTVNTGSGDGTIRLNLVDDDTITDTAGNKLGGTGTGNGDFTSGQSYTVDKTAPTVSMSSTASNPTNISPIAVTVTFSEDVTGFTSGDITPGNATISNFTGSGSHYTFNLAPSGDGSATADITSGVAQDSAGNGNTAATQFSRTYDTTAPSVTSFTATSPSSSLNISITAFAASDAVGVSGYLITESATPPSAGAAGWTASAPTSYSVAGDGTYTLYPWAKDAAGNVSAVYGSPASVTVETTAPSVVSSVRVNSTPTKAASVDFIVTFSESVSGVDTSDFSLVAGAGLTGASVTGVSGGPKIYTVSVNTGSGSGTLRLDVHDDDSIVDAAGNPLGGSGASNGNFSTGQSYTIDKIAPTAGGLVAATVTTAGGATYTFTITFSDNQAIDSTSIGAGDIRVSGPGGFSQMATLVSATPAGNGTPRTATYQIAAAGGAWDTGDNGTYTIALEANQVFDTAGNPTGAATLGSFMVSLNHAIYLPLVVR